MVNEKSSSRFLLSLSLWCCLWDLRFVTTGRATAFLSTSSSMQSGSAVTQRAPFSLRSALELQKGWFVPDDEREDADDNNDDDGDSNNGLVTREMLQRDLLADPQVQRKTRKGQGYKPLDNRDHLPFAVKQITPDPYTRQEVKKQRQHKSKFKRSDLELQLMSSRLTLTTNNDDSSTLLGEFQLDKSTTSGDIISLANGKHYRVETARCQYKYAGGQRFVMCRKILEVKEITRSIQEAELERQLAASPGISTRTSTSSSSAQQKESSNNKRGDDSASSSGSKSSRD